MGNINYFLVTLLALQQWFYMWQIQKLVDKAMSGSYTEYIRAKQKPVKVQVQPEATEDLRVMSEFSIL